MQLIEFLANKSNKHTTDGNLGVACNALYKTKDNFNCYLTPSQAISLARNLLSKAQIILDNDLEQTAVQLWNQGENTESLYFGLVKARKGARRSKAKKATRADQ